MKRRPIVLQISLCLKQYSFPAGALIFPTCTQKLRLGVVNDYCALKELLSEEQPQKPLAYRAHQSRCSLLRWQIRFARRTLNY